MSHIVSFKIDGLAGRKDSIEYSLQRDVNVFYGSNGSGKTSILKIIHSAMTNKTDILKKVPFKYAEVVIYSIQYDKNIKKSINMSKKNENSENNKNTSKKSILFNIINNEYNLISDDTEKEPEWEYSKKTPEEAKKASWSHSYLPTTRLYSGNDNLPLNLVGETSQNKVLTEENLDEFYANTTKLLWMMYSSKYLREAKIIQDEGLVSILKAVLTSRQKTNPQTNNNIEPNEIYERVKKFLDRQNSFKLLDDYDMFKDRYNKDIYFNNVVQYINDIECKISNLTNTRNKLQEMITKLFSGSKKVNFNDMNMSIQSSDNNVINLGSLSSGEKHLLHILIQAPLADENALLIDEPEMSMHIDWQRGLVKNMRELNPNAQLIIATHSPEIMADIEETNIFKL